MKSFLLAFSLCLFFSYIANAQYFQATIGWTGDDRGNYVQSTSDGGYVLVGSTTSYGVGASDVYLIRMDANGDTLWVRTYGTAADDIGYSADETPSGGFIITGTTTGVGYDAF